MNVDQEAALAYKRAEALKKATAPHTEAERKTWSPSSWVGVVWGPKPTVHDALVWAAIALEGPAPRNDAEAQDRQVAAVLRELAEAFPS